VHNQPGTAVECVPRDGIGEDIIIRDSQFAWKKESLEDPPDDGRRPFKLRIEGEVKFHQGGLNLITGPTGCGKTSLLMSLLGWRNLSYFEQRLMCTFSLHR